MAPSLKPEDIAMSKESAISDIVQTEVSYLVKDALFDVEKPYELAYDAEGIIPQTNMSDESRPIMIRKFRSFQKPDNFEQFGFAVMKVDYTLTAAEFQNAGIVKERYYPSIEKLLWQTFPEAAAVRIIEHDVSPGVYRILYHNCY